MINRCFLLAGVAAVPIVLTAPATAQEGEQLAIAASGNEIIVTAQRRAESLQDTPIAVSAFNQTMLAERGVDEVIKLAASTPSLLMTQGTASPSTIQLSMRGALEQNGGTITSESPVAIYIDDVYQSRLSAANFDLADIERVEVLRGPQGTLYGRNSMTGAIKLVTRQPDGDTWANVDLSFARFTEVKTKASLGAPITDTIAVAASVFYNNRDKGWQYNEMLDKDVSTFRRYGGQLAVGITNVDGLEAVLTGRYLKSESDGQHFLPIDIATYEPALPFYHTRTPREADGDNESYSVSARLGYDFGPVTLRSITAYQHLDETWALDFSGGYVQADGTIDAGFFRRSIAEQKQFTQEFQLLGQAMDDRLNFILGAFYYDEKAHSTTPEDYLGAFFLTFGPATLETSSRSLAFYGQADFEVAPGLTLTAGLRYTDDKKELDGTTPDGTSDVIVPVSNTINAKVWTPKFNVKYEFSGDAMVYGTVSRGYRAAGFNSLVIADPANFGRSYNPEFAWSYEAGFKVSTFDRRLTMNLAAYHQELSDLQTLALVGSGSFVIENAAKSKVQGIEFEASARPVTGLNIFGNVAYTHDEYTELDPNSSAGMAGAERLPLISRWQYQIGASYDFDLGDAGKLKVAGDYNYRSPYYSLVELPRSSLQKSIGRANATVTYTDSSDRFDIYAQVTNVFGSEDFFQSAEFIPGVFGYKMVLEPTVWRVGLRFRM